VPNVIPSMATLMAKKAMSYQTVTDMMQVCKTWSISEEKVIKKTPYRNGGFRGPRAEALGEGIL